VEIARPEMFGSVVSIITFDDLDQGIPRANNSDYWPACSIYNRDHNVALKACEQIHLVKTYIGRKNFEVMQRFHAGSSLSAELLTQIGSNEHL
jgi:lactaldehyde dehydrogenase / glycolaldehyde dehydrogenase